MDGVDPIVREGGRDVEKVRHVWGCDVVDGLKCK